MVLKGQIFDFKIIHFVVYQIDPHNPKFSTLYSIFFIKLAFCFQTDALKRSCQLTVLESKKAANWDKMVDVWGGVFAPNIMLTRQVWFQIFHCDALLQNMYILYTSKIKSESQKCPNLYCFQVQRKWVNVIPSHCKVFFLSPEQYVHWNYKNWITSLMINHKKHCGGKIMVWNVTNLMLGHAQNYIFTVTDLRNFCNSVTVPDE